MSGLKTLDEELMVVEVGKAEQIKSVFLPMFKMLEDMESQFNDISNKEVTKELCTKAKRLRLDIAKIRIEADKERKAQKDEYLRAGNAIQGVYNILKFAVTDKEEKLKAIEDYFDNLEKERVLKIEEERIAILEDLGEDVYPKGLGEMEESVFNNYVSGVQIARERKKQAEEEAQKEKEREELRQKRVFQCARISEYIEGFEKIDLSELSDQEYMDLVSKGKNAREKAQAEQERIRLESEKAQAEIKRLEAEKKEREEQEEKEKREAQAEQEKLDKAGDEEKFENLRNEIKCLINKYNFKAEEYLIKINGILKLL